MECPKCGIVLDDDFVECPRCGIVVAKFRAHHEAPEVVSAGPAPIEPAAPASHERVIRALAIPGALTLARLLVHASPGGVRMLSMWVHESGHAVTAWLCGFPAFPGPWVTPVAEQRSLPFTIALVAALGFGAYRAKQRERGFWVIVSTAALLLVLFFTFGVKPVQARQLITFGGDGGCFVLGTVLMLTVYAREDHPIRANHICWALLVVGALAFMDVYTVWSGPIDRLPFGEDDHGISDPSVLSEMYGWNVLMLIRHYMDLARACSAVLAVSYLAMLVHVRRLHPIATRAQPT